MILDNDSQELHHSIGTYVIVKGILQLGIDMRSKQKHILQLIIL